MSNSPSATPSTLNSPAATPKSPDNLNTPSLIPSQQSLSPLTPRSDPSPPVMSTTSEASPLTIQAPALTPSPQPAASLTPSSVSISLAPQAPPSSELPPSSLASPDTSSSQPAPPSIASPLAASPLAASPSGSSAASSTPSGDAALSKNASFSSQTSTPVASQSSQSSAVGGLSPLHTQSTSSTSSQSSQTPLQSRSTTLNQSTRSFSSSEPSFSPSTTLPASYDSAFDSNKFRPTSTEYTSVWTQSGVTLTSVVLVPTLVPVKGHASTARSSKIIGGVVGSIGGALVITALAALYIILRRRKSLSLTNQLPDFQDGLGLERDPKGFIDLALGTPLPRGKFGAVGSFFGNAFGRGHNVHDDTPAGAAYNSSPVADSQSSPQDQQEQGLSDFMYRGVAQNNNLDAVFRSASALDRASSSMHMSSLRGVPGGTVAGATSGGTTPAAAAAYGGRALPRAELNESDEEKYTENARNSASPYSSNGEYGDVVASPDSVSPLPYPLDDRNHFYQAGSNNSRSRFAEQI